MGDKKELYKELLQMYKDFEYLWNPNHQLYLNREARDKANDILLEKYKFIHEKATLQDFKKKLDNMRTTFRREHKKVLLSRLNGDKEEYVPQLWYYENMLFLNEIAEYNLDASLIKSKGEDHEESTPKKRFKPERSSTVYLSDPFQNETEYFDTEEVLLSNHENSEDYTNDDECDLRTVHTKIQRNNRDLDRATEAFGTTVGLQLKDVEKTQRAIAEKLISDVVFLARMDKLTFNSSINLNS